MAGGLTPKQARFVEEYLIDLNATQAAIRAGYSPPTAQEQSSRLLSNVIVASAVAKAMEQRSARTEITQDMVLRELAKIGFSDIRKAVKWYSQTNVAAIDTDAEIEALAEEGALRFAVANQVELVSSDEIDDDTAAAVSEVSMTDRGGLKVKFHDKQAALVNIGRHIGMFRDRVELTGKDGAPIETRNKPDLSKLTKEEARNLEAMLAKAEGGDA